MPTGRLMFLLFVLVLIGALVYLKAVDQDGAETVTLSPKAYIERVESDKQRERAPDAGKAGE